MAETNLPAAKASGNDETSVLLGYLAYHRAVLARKAEGISEADARRAACPPSDLTLLGLIRHMADVERGWFRRGLGEDVGPIYYGSAHPEGDDDGDFHPPPDATLADAFATYWAEIDAADRNIANASFDDIDARDPDGSSLRRIIVHMIEEYARHCGHADLLRQAIDGSVGD